MASVGEVKSQFINIPAVIKGCIIFLSRVVLRKIDKKKLIFRKVEQLTRKFIRLKKSINFIT